MTASKVTDTLYIGDWQDARATRQSRPEIAIMTVAVDSPFTGDWRFDLVDGTSDPQHNLKPLVAAISLLTSLQSENRITLVHCVSGISRSAVVIIGFLMKTGMTLDDALVLLKKVRPVIDPEPDLLELLKDDEGFRR